MTAREKDDGTTGPDPAQLDLLRDFFALGAAMQSAADEAIAAAELQADELRGRRRPARVKSQHMRERPRRRRPRKDGDDWSASE